MHYHIETPLNPHMVEELGKEQAVARITTEAWVQTIYENQGARAIRLLSTEERASAQFGSTVRAYRFTFVVE